MDANELWLEYVVKGKCSICANSSIIDSRGRKTPAGVEVGTLSWCICPNGRHLKELSGGKNPKDY